MGIYKAGMPLLLKGRQKRFSIQSICVTLRKATSTHLAKLKVWSITITRLARRSEKCL